jgi:hypothetical protein
MEGLGEKIDDSPTVKKFLHVVPTRNNQVTEMFSDMKTLTIEELGHLRAAEDRFEPSVEQVTEKAQKLLLTERCRNHPRHRVRRVAMWPLCPQGQDWSTRRR